MTSTSVRFLILITLASLCFSYRSGQLSAFPENTGAIIFYLNVKSLQSLVQTFLPIMSYFVFTDTSGLIPISNKVGKTFVIDQTTESFWARFYIQNVTFDKVAGFSEEIKFVDQNKILFKLKNLNIEAQVNAGIDLLRILPIQVDYISMSDINLEFTFEVNQDPFQNNQFQNWHISQVSEVSFDFVDVTFKNKFFNEVVNLF